MNTIIAEWIGEYWEGFGHVLPGDVGKLYFVADGSYHVESQQQLRDRLRTDCELDAAMPLEVLEREQDQ